MVVMIAGRRLTRQGTTGECAVDPRSRGCWLASWKGVSPSGASPQAGIEEIAERAGSGHLDPCNIVNSPTRFYRNRDLLNEVFDRLGRWIVSCHAKDLTWDEEMNLHFREVRPGAGSMDYTTYLKRLATLGHNAPLMLEHLPNAEEHDKGRTYLFDLGRKIGVSFG